MSAEWERITEGHRLPRHEELVGDGNANLLEGTTGGFSNADGYGPYTLAPGDSIRNAAPSRRIEPESNPRPNLHSDFRMGER